MVFTQDGDVRDDIHRGDIGCEDNDAGAGNVASSLGRFAQGFNNFFDSTLQGLVFRGYRNEHLSANCTCEESDWGKCNENFIGKHTFLHALQNFLRDLLVC